ncbi:hypothetical protein O0I10_000732 [Lichtheimia ornata]|uniref:Phosphatidate phosphatase APP1 catalytic domain-containing protein n=1 Tax=Lichtheimia ornata TaxID=688661 RepID=A0AAD7Y476_9FUNG|nr:uncharacterized protein O0I10_000732 [Lichtheimia ornata]KAJ8663490.1 hypothetical protein O0I10_000732 [Lichtheimia ornata]
MQTLHPYAPTLSPPTTAPRPLLDNECNDMMDSPTTTTSSTSMPSSAATRLSGGIQSGDRECVLFPTYAMRNPQDSSEWLIRTKGWALSHNISPAKQRIAMGVTKSFVGSADRPSTALFEQRFKYFLAKNKGNKQFVINAVGTTSVFDSRRPAVTTTNNATTFNSSSTALTETTETTAVADWNDEDDDDEQVAVAASKIEPFFVSGTSRRSSAGSNDSGFQSASDETTIASKQDYHHYEHHFPDIDPFLASRPGNPLSTILDGGRSKSFSPYADNNNNIASEYQSHTISSPQNTDLDLLDNYLHNQLTTTSIESASDCDNTSSSSCTSLPMTTYSVQLHSDSNGIVDGHFIIPHSQVLSWANEQHHCDARILHLQSLANTFLPSYGTVSLVEPSGISIISDIDDTIKDTQILAGAKTVLANTFFKHCRDVPGMAEAYMRWYTQGASFHYVSNSPFQLMPMLQNFLQSCEFPSGSMHLREEGSLLARLVEVPGKAKRDAISQIIRDFPQRKFVLIGDSGEIDLEIYARLASEFPGRILKIMIRDVSTTPSSSPTPEDGAKKQNGNGLLRRNSTTLASLFSRKQQTSASSNEPRLAKVVNSITPLQARLLKAKRQCPDVDIVLFQDAQTLKDDTDIRDALWQSWDDQASASSASSSSYSSSSSSS